MKNQRVAELSKYSVFLFMLQKRPWEQTRAGLRTPESKFFSQTAPDHAGYKHHHDQGGVNSPTHCMLFTFTCHLLVHSNIFFPFWCLLIMWLCKYTRDFLKYIFLLNQGSSTTFVGGPEFFYTFRTGHSK